jgi:cystathionine beta-lyase/cystathionine gamma-synthase
VPRILHPGLPSHPQHNLAMAQMDACGPDLRLRGRWGRKQAHGLLDALELVDISNNIGDSRSLMTHPARPPMPAWRGEALEMGVTEGMLRLNVGPRRSAGRDRGSRSGAAVRPLTTGGRWGCEGAVPQCAKRAA